MKVEVTHVQIVEVDDDAVDEPLHTAVEWAREGDQLTGTWTARFVDDSLERGKFVEEHPDWEARVQGELDLISSVIRFKLATLGAYPALINGREVTVIGAVEIQPNGQLNSKALFVLYDDTMHELVQMHHGTRVEATDAE